MLDETAILGLLEELVEHPEAYLSCKAAGASSTCAAFATRLVMRDFVVDIPCNVQPIMPNLERHQESSKGKHIRSCFVHHISSCLDPSIEH